MTARAQFRLAAAVGLRPHRSGETPREPFSGALPQACSMNLLAAWHDEPAKPLVVTVVSPWS